MSSRFERLVRSRGAPLLVEAIGERDENGSAMTHYYLPPGQQVSPIKILGAILGNTVGGEEEEAGTGNIVGRERRSWVVLTSVLVANGVKRLQRNAVADLGTEGKWPIDIQQSNWGESFVTFNLVREPLLSGKRFESRAV